MRSGSWRRCSWRPPPTTPASRPSLPARRWRHARRTAGSTSWVASSEVCAGGWHPCGLVNRNASVAIDFICLDACCWCWVSQSGSRFPADNPWQLQPAAADSWTGHAHIGQPFLQSAKASVLRIFNFLRRVEILCRPSFYPDVMQSREMWKEESLA